MICVLISLYASAWDHVQSMVGADRFIEVFVDTPVSVCEQREVKRNERNVYSGEKGSIKGSTPGVDDLYELSRYPELTIDTIAANPEQSAQVIMDYLEGKGYLPREPFPSRKTGST